MLVHQGCGASQVEVMSPLENGMVIALELATDRGSGGALSDEENGEQAFTSPSVSGQSNELAKQRKRKRPAVQIDANHEAYVGQAESSVQFD